MQAHLLLTMLVPGDPALERLGKLIRIQSPDHLPAPLRPVLLIPHIVSPNGKCPLNIFLTVFHFNLPDRLQGLVFGTIDGFRVHPLEPPCVEKLLQELSPSELGTQVTLLYLDLKRLECSLMPLFNSNF